MARVFLLLGAAVVATGMALAQDATGAGAAINSQSQTQTRTPSTTGTDVIRGCLSGSTGNYTVTDRNGMQYQVNGDDNILRSMVGREVEITLSEDRSSDDATHASGAATHSADTVQASSVKAVASSCKPAPGGTAPDTGITPNTTHPADERPAPQMMSMFQQQGSPGQSQNGSAPQVQSTPPVTSQTPANSASPINTPNPQVGNSPANSAGMTESEANHSAQATRQGEVNTGTQTGQATGRGVNNQGANSPSTTNPNAVPTPPSSATPSADSQQWQANCRNTKPIYECQATDIPWANSSGGNTGTPPPPH